MTGSPADVLRMIEDGGKSQAIADLTGLPRREVVRIARENGYGLNVSNDRFQRVAAPKPLATGGIVRMAPTQAAAGGITTEVIELDQSVPLRPVERDLIAEGKASSIARIVRAASAAEKTLTILADLLEEHRATEAARIEVARLEKKLADAKARLKGGRKDDGPSLDAKTVRAWAAQNGIDCPSRGRPPQRVVDAYREAVAS